MQIKCLHGYFIFTEDSEGEVSKLSSLFNLDLALKNNYYTFDTLESAPEYSIIGGTYLGAPVIKTFEGKPWEVMRENNLVYDFLNDVVVSIDLIVKHTELDQSDYFYLSPGLILPGSITDDGSRITDYAAWFSFDEQSFKYSEVGFE